ncbi:MAG TPA: heavy metal-binding domain-containing protein [Solirubrobacteraceae bacterium]|jgi:uncharacterized protein YbjQ (UPF0145 family)|nr:heavy metal-binding domain-containing protein [Solirubrobacteraceae bacterium]
MSEGPHEPAEPLPEAAEQRLSSSAFTSGLSVTEWALATQLGMRPVGQVLGTSVFQHGRQFLPQGWVGEEAVCELHARMSAWDRARGGALDRLSEEARRLQADAVVGVRVHRAEGEYGPGTCEYAVFGTAVRFGDREDHSWPILTDLSVDDYYRLRVAGYAGVGLLATTAVVFVSPSTSTRLNRMATFSTNQEMQDYTRGVIGGRDLARRRIRSQASSVQATDVVGLTVEHHVEHEEFEVGYYGSDVNRHGFMITVHMLGTAVRHIEQVPLYPPEGVNRLGVHR